MSRLPTAVIHSICFALGAVLCGLSIFVGIRTNDSVKEWFVGAAMAKSDKQTAMRDRAPDSADPVAKPKAAVPEGPAKNDVVNAKDISSADISSADISSADISSEAVSSESVSSEAVSSKPFRPAVASRGATNSSVGMDAGRPTYWSPLVIFADALRCCDIAAGDADRKREWAERGCHLEADGFIFPIMTVLPAVDHTKPFTLQLTGEISVRFRDSLNRKRFAGPGRFDIHFPDRTEEGVMIVEKMKEGADAKLFYPGEEGRLFHSAYVDALRGFQTIRGLDFFSTNGIGYKGNRIEKWEDHAQPSTWGQASKLRGAAHQYFRLLGEEIGADLWVPFPVRADDRYLDEMAKVYAGYPHTIIFEYSNENWNFANPFRYQRRYCLEQANKHGITGKYDWEQVMRWQARRTIEAADIIRKRIPDAKIVYSWQATSTSVSRILKEFDYSKIDAIACAPYLALFKGKTPDQSEQTAGTVDELLRRAELYGIQWAVEKTEAYKKQADELGLELWAYEFGSHLDENRIIFKTHADPRFEAVYQRYVDATLAAGITRGCLFTLVQKPNERMATSFGQMTYLGDDSPRWRVSRSFKKKLDGR